MIRSIFSIINLALLTRGTICFTNPQTLSITVPLSSQRNNHGLFESMDENFELKTQKQTKTTTRRKFLKKVALTSATATFFAPYLSNAASTAAEKTTVRKQKANTTTGITLPPMGLGAWAWGDSLFWGYSPKEDGDLKQVFDYAVSKELAFFDTAELYGLGRSESLIGKFSNNYPSDIADTVKVATKFAALPFRTKPQSVVNACKDSMKRLNGGKKPIDLYQIHFPNAWSNEEYWDGLAQCYEQGLVKAVGVSNYGVDAVRAVHSKLAERGIPLFSNQIQLSLLYRYPLENGLLNVCKELDMKVLSYSPLALGFLTGKYSKDNFPKGPRGKIAKNLFTEKDDSLSGLLKSMNIVSENHGGVPLSQVALNWVRAKGTIPIPGARSLKQVTQNLGALDWELSKQEMQALDIASAKVPAYVQAEDAPFAKLDINTKLKMFDS